MIPGPITYTHVEAGELRFDSFEGQVAGILVPWHERATVVHEGELVPEQFDARAFDHDLAAHAKVGVSHWIRLNFHHQASIDDDLGHMIGLEKDDDGLRGTFKVRKEKLHSVADVIGDGIRGFSIGFVDQGSKFIGGVMHRQRARLVHVALTATPAYEGARVLSVRAPEVPPPPPIEVVATPNFDSVRDFLASLSGQTPAT